MTNDEESDTSPPVVLVHGWGGSFVSTWQRSGFTALLEDAGRDVIGVDLMGHGDAPKPHDDNAYADLTTRVIDALPDVAVDAIGFSLGAHTLLRIATANPDRFRRLVLAGIGRTVFERDEDSHREVVRAVEGAETTDNRARLFAQYANQPGNDPAALAAVLRSDHAARLTEEDLARVTCLTLVAVGDQDFVLPADRLVDSLPNATFQSLRRTDHFATPESFDFIDATLEFLDANPS